jgi:hypothetical protein
LGFDVFDAAGPVDFPESVPPQAIAPNATKPSKRFMFCTDRSRTAAKVKGAQQFSQKLAVKASLASDRPAIFNREKRQSDQPPDGFVYDPG